MSSHASNSGELAASRWAAVVPVGPSENDIGRLSDLLAALVRYEPNPGPVVVLNDGGNEARLAAVLEQHAVKGVVLPTPRGGIGNPWLGRLTSGLGCAFRYVYDHFPEHHVLRIDSDALIIAPFAERIAGLLMQHPDAGLVGSVELTQDGGRTGSWFAPRVYRMGKRVSRWDHKPYFRTSFFGPRARMRHLLARARRHGYKPAYAACGGAYFLTAGAIRRLHAAGTLSDLALLADDIVTEDIFFSIAVHATGLKLVEQNAVGDVFGVCWKGLPARSLPALLERKHAIVHSLKDHGAFKEDATRAFFRDLRQGDARANVVTQSTAA